MHSNHVTLKPKVFDSGIQCMQQNPLQRNLQKRGIDCNLTAFVSGLRCTLSKIAVHRIPLQKFKIPTFGTVMFLRNVYLAEFIFFVELCGYSYPQKQTKIQN